MTEFAPGINASSTWHNIEVLMTVAILAIGKPTLICVAHLQAMPRWADNWGLRARYAKLALTLHHALRSPKHVPTVYKSGTLFLPESLLYRFCCAIEAWLLRRIQQWRLPTKHKIAGKPRQTPTSSNALLKRIASGWIAQEGTSRVLSTSLIPKSPYLQELEQ